MSKDRLKEDLASYAKGKFPQLGNGYYYDFRDNIFGRHMDFVFEQSFLDGDGNELASKACAPHSSSMLGYNFFHWINRDHPITIVFGKGEINTYNEVLFEVKIPVISRSNANMDIVLRNNDGDWLFIESKFLEYLNTGSFEISKAYTSPGERTYFFGGDIWPKFIKEYDVSEKKQYWGGIKQAFCHLIGLTNWMNKIRPIEAKGTKNYYIEGCETRFINLVFEPQSHDYQEEHECFIKYEGLHRDLRKQLRERRMIPTGLKVDFMTYSQLWECVKKCPIPDGLEKFLYERYMRFAEGY